MLHQARTTDGMTCCTLLAAGVKLRTLSLRYVSDASLAELLHPSDEGMRSRVHSVLANLERLHLEKFRACSSQTVSASNLPHAFSAVSLSLGYAWHKIIEVSPPALQVSEMDS